MKISAIFGAYNEYFSQTDLIVKDFLHWGVINTSLILIPNLPETLNELGHNKLHSVRIRRAR